MLRFERGCRWRRRRRRWDGLRRRVVEQARGEKHERCESEQERHGSAALRDLSVSPRRAAPGRRQPAPHRRGYDDLFLRRVGASWGEGRYPRPRFTHARRSKSIESKKRGERVLPPASPAAGWRGRRAFTDSPSKPKQRCVVAPLASPLPARPSHLAVSHRSPHFPAPTRGRGARKNRAARARGPSPKSPSRFGSCLSNFSRARSPPAPQV